MPEIDVLIAVVKWLHSDGWTIESLSPPSGQKIDSADNKRKLTAALAALGIEEKNVRLLAKGEDIRASQGDNLWRIECKSLGADLPSSTIRSQFDRALASTVSYYGQTDGLRLGLALPEEYIKLIQNRVPQTLRKAISLWILLYVSADNEVYVFAPDEEIPS